MRALSAAGQLGRCMDKNHGGGGEDFRRATRRGLRCACICRALDVAPHAPTAPWLGKWRGGGLRDAARRGLGINRVF
eukprot:14295044-Alexandrium_andersonii.AAC.1